MAGTEPPSLVVFVLDQVSGRPACGAQLVLLRRDDEDVFTSVHLGTTGDDGCFVVSAEMARAPGRYRVEIQSGLHFSNLDTRPTFPGICIDFGWDGAEKLVLPVLMTPHGYTAYRGS